MSYLNRFLIDEDVQFECFGVYDDDFYYNIPLLEMLKNISADKSVTGHVIIAADMTKYISWTRHKSVCEVQCEDSIVDSNMMVSCIESERLECFQKENYENFFNGGMVISFDSGYNFQQANNSIGDDIEVFYEQIITGKLVPDYQKQLCKASYNKNHKSTVASFHLSMLSDDEENKMHADNRNFVSIRRRYSCFKFKTLISKHEQNYALSVCYRRTTIRHKELFYHCVSKQ